MTVSASKIFRFIFLFNVTFTLLLALAGWAGTFWRDGTAPYYWTMIVVGVAPLLGMAVLLVSIIILAFQRRFVAWNMFAFVAGFVAVFPLMWQLIIGPLSYPASLAKTKPAVTVNWPFDQPGRVAWGGDTIRENYHVATPDQRWAYDIVIEPYFVGSKKLADYGCFGKPVVAPAGGQVIIASDGADDIVPTKKLPFIMKNPFGNYIAIKLETTGTYLIIAHLQKGSIKVKKGDRLQAGQLIAACGNSGNTSEPHVHIHHQRQSPVDRPVNLAEGLPLYFNSAAGPKMPRGGFSAEGRPIGDIMRPYNGN